jgi:hypothetical protein
MKEELKKGALAAGKVVKGILLAFLILILLFIAYSAFTRAVVDGVMVKVYGCLSRGGAG